MAPAVAHPTYSPSAMEKGEPPVPAMNGAGAQKTTSGAANCSLICGIIGLIFFGIILGPVAICTSVQAKNEIKQNPEKVGGECQANAGMVLGVIDTVLCVIYIIVIAGNTSSS